MNGKQAKRLRRLSKQVAGDKKTELHALVKKVVDEDGDIVGQRTTLFVTGEKMCYKIAKKNKRELIKK